MNEWKKLSVAELKRLIKSRSGRIAELDVELRILNSLIDTKIEAGEYSQEPKKQHKKADSVDIGKTEPTEQKEAITKPIEQMPKPSETPKNNPNLGELDI